MGLGEKQSFFGRLSKKIGDIFMMRPTPDEDMLAFGLVIRDHAVDRTFPAGLSTSSPAI